MSEPRISKEAQDDLGEIHDWLAERSIDAAQRTVRSILDRIRLQGNMPMMGCARDDLQTSLRSFVVRPYTVFYRPADDTIEVVRVLHGSRDIDSIMRADPDE